jgi:exosortase
VSDTVSKRGMLEEFKDEFLEFWRKLPDKELFLGLLAAWVLLFHFLGHCSFNFTSTPSLFQWMLGAYSAPALDSEHGKLVPFVVLFLLWLKRNEFLALTKGLWWPGLIGLAISLGLHIIGYIAQQPRLSIVAFFTGIYSLLGLIWGWRFMKAGFLPFMLFLFCIPFGNMMDKITFPLRLVATKITYIVTHGILGLPIIQQGTQLSDGEGGYSYEVAAACSGIRSLIPLLALTTIYGALTFKTAGKRLLMVFMAVPLALGCNVLRLIAIIITHSAFGEKPAHLVHEWFGFVTYAIALVSVFLLGHFMERGQERPAATPTEVNAV